MKFEIPNEAILYIIYQRTHYLKDNLFFKILTRLGGYSTQTYKLSVWLKSKLFVKKITQAFYDDIANDYRSIKQHLPDEASNILDIGSGVAGIDIFFNEHYQKSVKIHLLDKTALDTEVFYNFNPKTAYYNSLEIAKKMLVVNNVPEENIYLHSAENPSEAFIDIKYDLITSFISWGFHYPVSTYIDSVHQSLSTGGALIIDIRKGTTGLKEIQDRFSKTTVITEYPVHQTVLAIK